MYVAQQNYTKRSNQYDKVEKEALPLLLFHRR
jgi:hypothetical protein